MTAGAFRVGKGGVTTPPVPRLVAATAPEDCTVCALSDTWIAEAVTQRNHLRAEKLRQWQARHQMRRHHTVWWEKTYTRRSWV
ncbi:hypothetical protein ACFP1Z_20930 [Streptomyces gamaensis]|uniref:Transposase n=1 Tax=Streptomyces gamaensis TaxID=1763542 RepID=A0ABW0Z3X8_9ACTN